MTVASRPSALAPGAPAPAFELSAAGGGLVSLAALAGRPVVIFFFPKADTAGCTREAIAFSELKDEFDSAGVAVVGVSADPVKALDKFKSKHGLAVALASDETRSMIEAYGVWVEKSMYGKSYMGIERTTVLIDAAGRVAKVWPKVKVEGHAAEVLAATRAL